MAVEALTLENSVLENSRGRRLTKAMMEVNVIDVLIHGLYQI